MTTKLRRDAKGQFTKVITDFEIVDLGIEHSNYFPGFGTCFTPYNNCCYGIGNDAKEALDDCLDMAAQQTEYETDWEAVEELIRERYPDFWNAKLVSESAVEFDNDPDDGTDPETPYYHIGMRWND